MASTSEKRRRRSALGPSEHNVFVWDFVVSQCVFSSIVSREGGDVVHARTFTEEFMYRTDKAWLTATILTVHQSKSSQNYELKEKCQRPAHSSTDCDNIFNLTELSSYRGRCGHRSEIQSAKFNYIMTPRSIDQRSPVPASGFMRLHWASNINFSLKLQASRLQVQPIIRYVLMNQNGKSDVNHHFWLQKSCVVLFISSASFKRSGYQVNLI